MNQYDCFRRILIVDDTPENRLDYASLILSDMSPGKKTPIRASISVASDPEEALEALKYGRAFGHPYDLLVTDLVMSPLNGLWLINQLKRAGFDPKELDVILLSTKEGIEQYKDKIDIAEKSWVGDSEKGVVRIFKEEMATSDGNESATDFLKAVWSGVWAKLDDSLFAELTKPTTSTLSQASFSWKEEFITQDDNLIRQIDMILAMVGKCRDASILIMGESGTGKEVLAKLIHKASLRADKPFKTINCASIHEELFESIVFGHEKGSFTGASAMKKGFIEEAEGGILFLDEIGELALGSQSKMLRALQERRINRLGSSKDISVDFQLIAATNRNLTEEITRNTFRLDLFYRIQEFAITLPPLGNRPGDVIPLIDYFLKEEEKKAGTTKANWDQSAKDYLYSKSWPGNARQLKLFVGKIAALHSESNSPVTRDVIIEIENIFRDTTAPFCPGLDELRLPVQRLRHLVFFPILKEVIPQKKNEEETLDELALRAWGSHGHFFTDETGEKALKKIRSEFVEHKRENVCKWCRKLWLQYFRGE